MTRTDCSTQETKRREPSDRHDQCPHASRNHSDTTAADVRTVLAVAVLFAVLGGGLVYLAGAESGPYAGVVLAAGVAVAAVAAATAIFGGYAVRTATDLRWP